MVTNGTKEAVHMGQVIYFHEYLRARLAVEKTAIITPRPRDRRRGERAPQTASDLSKELRRLLE